MWIAKHEFQRLCADRYFFLRRSCRTRVRGFGTPRRFHEEILIISRTHRFKVTQCVPAERVSTHTMCCSHDTTNVPGDSLHKLLITKIGEHISPHWIQGKHPEIRRREIILLWIPRRQPHCVSAPQKLLCKLDMMHDSYLSSLKCTPHEKCGCTSAWQSEFSRFSQLKYSA